MNTDLLGRKALTEALADKAGLSKGYVSQLVNGHRDPSYATALEIEAVTGLPLDFWKEKNRGAAMWHRIMESK